MRLQARQLQFRPRKLSHPRHPAGHAVLPHHQSEAPPSATAPASSLPVVAVHILSNHLSELLGAVLPHPNRLAQVPACARCISQCNTAKQSTAQRSTMPAWQPHLVAELRALSSCSRVTPLWRRTRGLPSTDSSTACAGRKGEALQMWCAPMGSIGATHIIKQPAGWLPECRTAGWQRPGSSSGAARRPPARLHAWIGHLGCARHG